MNFDIRYVFLTVVLLGTIAGCSKPSPFESHKYDEEIDKSRTYRNIRIPEELRDILLAGSKDAAPEPVPEKAKDEHKAEPEGDHGEKGKEGEAQAAPPPPPDAEFDRAVLRVFLHEKTTNILKGRNTVLDYKAGGGELDLAEFLSQKNRGTFYMAVRPSFEQDLPFEVYFLGNSKARRLGDEELGGGCKSFVKITKYFAKQMKDEGFAVNTTDQRHVNALQGTYFFVFKKPSGRVGLAYLEVKDSRFPEMACR